MVEFNDRRDGSSGDLPDKFKCPRCGGFIPNNKTPGAYPGAISRRDGKTEICSTCGTYEALSDWQIASNLPDYSGEDRIRDFQSEENANNYGAFSWDNPTHYLNNDAHDPYSKNAGNPLHWYDEKTRLYQCPDCGRNNMSARESRDHDCGGGEEVK